MADLNRRQQAIGQAAVGLIEDNTTVAINIGTTTEAVGNALSTITI